MSNVKNLIIDWQEFRNNIRNSSPVDLAETPAQKAKRIAELEADPDEWKKYYFKKYFKYASPDFHSRASRRLLTNFIKKRHWYEVRHWARGLSKSTLTMMDVLYLVLTGKLKNIVLTSSTEDAAVAFLEKYRAELDSNQRIINDYGPQELPGFWAMGDFATRQGVRFLALGARQSPRGNGNQQFRVDCIIVDDFDTDEECRNPDIINQKWDWFEKALFFTVDTAEPYLIIWLGNIIAPDCCVVRAGKIAEHTEIINIRDENNVSVWPQKNREEDIQYQIDHTSYEASQQELFNNPIRQGQTFKDETWGKCPPLKSLPFVISYSDPATSNRDKPVGKSKAQNSMKVTVLLGQVGNKFFVYKVKLDNMTQSQFIDGMYFMRNYVNNETALYSMIENNTLQAPILEQIIMPLIYEKGKEYGGVLSVTPDARVKGDKWSRIEANLEMLYRLGLLVFNIDEIDDPHMKRLVAQFKSASATARETGGPDAVEGGVFISREKYNLIAAGGMQITERRRSSNKAV